MRYAMSVLGGLLGLSLLGQPMVPGKALPRAPLVILDELTTLKVAEIPPLAEEERTFLTGVWEDRAQAKTPTAGDDPRVLEAALFASGVRMTEERRRRRDQVEALIKKAQEATLAAKTPAERADLLLKHLHATALKGGYESKQSSLPVLLDSGKFNCVSASLLYFLVGTRLELKLQPIAIPRGLFVDGHVSLDLLQDGKRVQVEPTGPDGFDYETRIKQPGAVIFGPRPDRKQAVDIDPLGLAAAIYANRGADRSKAEPPQFGEAAQAYLCALALDPRGWAGADLKGVFQNWGPVLQKGGQHEEAIRVLQFGRGLDPEHRELRDNLEVVWQRYIDATLASGKDAEGIELTRRAARDLPLIRDFQNAGRSFERYGWTVFEEKGPEAALPVGERGLKRLQGKEAEELREWRNGIYRRWSQQLLDRKDLDGSHRVMVQAYAADRTSREITEGIAYHLQEALKQAEAAGGPMAAGKEFARATKAFPELKELNEVAEAFVQRGVRELTQQKKYPEAIKRVTDHAVLLSGAEQRAEAGSLVYDLWARSLADEKKWEAALEKYAEGLRAYPKQARLVNNAAVVVDRWADGPYQAKMWDEAIAIYERGLKLLPDHPGLTYNLKICRDRKAGK